MGMSTQGAEYTNQQNQKGWAEEAQEQARKCAEAENAAASQSNSNQNGNSSQPQKGWAEVAQEPAQSNSSYGGGYGTQPPNDTQYGGGSNPSSGSYTADLFEITKSAATMYSDTPHPDLPGATTGNIHSYAELHYPNYAADYNSLSGLAIASHHPERPVVEYSTNIPTDDLVRLHRGSPEGDWATQSSYINDGNISGVEAKQILSLWRTPDHVSDVSLPIGTTVIASRPDSDLARQFNFPEAQSEWFSNSRKLG